MARQLLSTSQQRESRGWCQCARCGRSTWIACRRATTPARPARTSRPGSPRRRPAATARPGRSSSATTRCRRCTGASAITRARTRATARTWTKPVSIHAVERFLGDMALAEGWTIAPDAPPSGKRVLVVGAGPSGLSAAWHLARRGHAVVIHEAGPLAGGMMHFGIPKYRLPREVLDGEIARIRGTRRRDRPQSQGRGPHGREGGGRLRRRVPRRRRAPEQAPGHPRARRRQDLRRAAVPEGGRESAPSKPQHRPPRGDLRRRQHGDGRRPHGEAARRRRAAHHLPPHPRADAGPRLRSRRGDRGRRQDPLAAHDQADRRHDASRSSG